MNESVEELQNNPPMKWTSDSRQLVPLSGASECLMSPVSDKVRTFSTGGVKIKKVSQRRRRRKKRNPTLPVLASEWSNPLVHMAPSPPPCVCVHECMLSLPYIAQLSTALFWDCEIRLQPKSATQSVRLCSPVFIRNTRTLLVLEQPLHTHHFCCVSVQFTARLWKGTKWMVRWMGTTTTLLMTGPSCLPLSLWERGILVSRGLPLHAAAAQCEWRVVVIMC